MLKLYGNSFSQCSRRVVALMVEAGIDYDENEVDLMGGAQYTPEFLAMNPNHSVPTIKDGDVCINESNAILRYLCNKHGLDNWYPTDPVDDHCGFEYLIVFISAWDGKGGYGGREDQSLV